jgi:hypothetical protein
VVRVTRSFCDLNETNRYPLLTNQKNIRSELVRALKRRTAAALRLLLCVCVCVEHQPHEKKEAWQPAERERGPNGVPTKHIVMSTSSKTWRSQLHFSVIHTHNRHPSASFGRAHVDRTCSAAARRPAPACAHTRQTQRRRPATTFQDERAQFLQDKVVFGG